MSSSSSSVLPSPAMTLRAMYARCSDSEPLVFVDHDTITPLTDEVPTASSPPSSSRHDASSPLAASDHSHNNRRSHDETFSHAHRCRSSPAADRSEQQPQPQRTSNGRPPSATQYSVGALRAKLSRPTSASTHTSHLPYPRIVNSSINEAASPVEHKEQGTTSSSQTAHTGSLRPRPPSATKPQQHLPPVVTSSSTGGTTTSFCSNTDSPRSMISTQASMGNGMSEQSINSVAGNPYGVAVRSVGSSSLLTAMRTFSSSEMSYHNTAASGNPHQSATNQQHVAVRRLDSSTRRAITSAYPSAGASGKLHAPSAVSSTSPIGFSISANNQNPTPNEYSGATSPAVPLGHSGMTVSSLSAATQPHQPMGVAHGKVVVVVPPRSDLDGARAEHHAAMKDTAPMTGDASMEVKSDEPPPIQRVLTALPLLHGVSDVSPPSVSPQAGERQTRMVFASWVPMTIDVAPDEAPTPRSLLRQPPAAQHAVTTTSRIEEFLKTVEGDGSISPSNPVQDFLTSSIEAAMAVSGLSKPPTEVDDMMTVSMRPLSVYYLWLLFRVYVRLRMFAARWRRTHQKKSESAAGAPKAQPKDQVQELMTTLDSTNWVHVFNVRWQENQLGVTGTSRATGGDGVPSSSSSGSAVAGPTATSSGAMQSEGSDASTVPVSSSPLEEGVTSTSPTTSSNGNAVTTTTIHVPDMPARRRGSRDRSSGAASTASTRSARVSTARSDGFERAMLHLSTSHLYISSVNSTASWTLRYSDVLKVVPKPSGVEIQFASTQVTVPPTAADLPTIWFDGGLGSQSNPLSKSVMSNAPSAMSATVNSGEDLAEPSTTLKSTPSGYFHFSNDARQASPQPRSKSPQHNFMLAASTMLMGGSGGASAAQSTSSRSPLLAGGPASWNNDSSVNIGAMGGTVAAFQSGSFEHVHPPSNTTSVTRRVVIQTAEITTITHAILEMQSQYLRGFSMSLADRLLLKHQTRTLHIVHFNDVYHLPSFKPASARGVVGGAGRFHTVLARLRETTNPLVLFSGDFMGPSLMSVITKGKQMVDALNFLGVHYGCFGNHEFDFGLRVLKEVIHGYTQGKHIYTGSQTKWVMSNMIEGATDDGAPPIPLGGAKPYEITVWNNIRIGILGLCENWLPQCANLQPSEAEYLDMFETGERLATYLKETEGAELVFALTHNRNVNDRELAVRCPTIDYIFGGHDHKFKSEPKYRFLKSGQEFEYLSTIEVILAPNRKPKYRIDCTPITYDIKESDYMQGLITRYDAKMAEKLGRVIGKSEVALDSTEETVRFKEGMLTNFILDVIQSTMQTDLAFLGAAAISGKEIMPAGNVTLGDIFSWFPNETKIMTMKLKGSTIKKTLDVMVRELPAEAPSFPHPSQQLRFTINMMRKPPIVDNIFICGKPLDMDREYVCAVEDFVGIGKAKYKHVAAEGHVILGEDDAVQVVTMVRDFFLKRKASDVDAKEAAALKNVTKIVSSATHIGVDMDMAKSQRFIRSLICELMHCDKSSIFLVNQANATIHFLPDAVGDQKPTTIVMPLGVGLAGSCATQCEVLNIEDCYEDPRFNRAIDKQTGYRTKTMLCVPVLLDGKTCSAVVQAINKDNDALFDEIDEISLRVLGEQVSFQLRYQTIFQEARQELEFHAEWVLDVFRSMTSEVCLDLVSGLRVVQNHSASAFKCDNVRVFQYEDADDEGAASRSVKPAGSGSSAPVGSKARVYYTEEGLDDETIVVPGDIHPNSFIAELARSKTQRLIKDASKMMILRPNDNLSCRSVLGIPMISSAGQCVGFIVAYDKPRGFQHDDEIIGGYLGRLSTVAMENCVRLQKILAASSETTLPTVPTLPVDRIRVKGGWATARRAFKFAKTERSYMRNAGLPVIPMKAFFHNEEKSMHVDNDNTTNAATEFVAVPSSSGGMYMAREPTLVVDYTNDANDNSGQGQNKGSKHKNTALTSLWGKVRRSAAEVPHTDGSGSRDLTERSSRQIHAGSLLPAPAAGMAAARKRSSLANQSITNLFVTSSDDKPLTGNGEGQRTPRPPFATEEEEVIPPSQRRQSRRFTFQLDVDSSASAEADPHHMLQGHPHHEQTEPSSGTPVEVDATMPTVGVWDTEQVPCTPVAVN